MVDWQKIRQRRQALNAAMPKAVADNAASKRALNRFLQHIDTTEATLRYPPPVRNDSKTHGNTLQSWLDDNIPGRQQQNAWLDQHMIAAYNRELYFAVCSALEEPDITQRATILRDVCARFEVRYWGTPSARPEPAIALMRELLASLEPDSDRLVPDAAFHHFPSWVVTMSVPLPANTSPSVALNPATPAFRMDDILWHYVKQRCPENSDNPMFDKHGICPGYIPYITNALSSVGDDSKLIIISALLTTVSDSPRGGTPRIMTT